MVPTALADKTRIACPDGSTPKNHRRPRRDLSEPGLASRRRMQLCRPGQLEILPLTDGDKKGLHCNKLPLTDGDKKGLHCNNFCLSLSVTPAWHSPLTQSRFILAVTVQY